MVAAAAPNVRTIDLAHDVPPQDVRQGGLLLARLAPLMPYAVHVAVVDPGVGGERRAVAVQVNAGGVLVGPDNGLLRPAAEALGARAVVVLAPPKADVPATFHGRDVFAPAAAKLARGVPFAHLGTSVPLESLCDLRLPIATIEPGRISDEVAGRDTFGNVQLFATSGALARVGFSVGDRVVVDAGGAVHPAVVARAFGDVPAAQLIVYADAHRHVAIAVNGGDAAERLQIGAGSRVEIRVAPPLT